MINVPMTSTPAIRVLLVEDDAMIGITLTEMLQEMGHFVCTVSATEDDAVADATRFKPDLMIVDVYLEEGSGVAAMDRIHLSGPMPCIFVSGAIQLLGRSNAELLRKPFAERDLVRAIQNVVGLPQ